MICGYVHVVFTMASVSGAAEAIPAVPNSAAATPPDAIKALVAIRIFITFPTLVFLFERRICSLRANSVR